MEIKPKHLAALTAARKELETSLGFYAPGDYKQTEINRHLNNLKDLQKGLRDMRRERAGDVCQGLDQPSQTTQQV